MVPINALGWSWPTIRFFLNMKTTRKKKESKSFFYLFQEKRTSLPPKIRKFLTFRNKKALIILLEYIDIMKITDFLKDKFH